MREAEKFVYYPMQKPDRIQPDCPVFLYSYGLAVQKGSGAAFVQVRLVNRCQSLVNSVFLHISGKDILGRVLYELRFVPLVNCGGEAHKDFGEDQVLFLPQGNVRSLDIEIEDVLFHDGMIWRRQSGHKLLTVEEAGWITCTCGMKNPGEVESCAYCGLPVASSKAAVQKEPGHFLFRNMKTLTEADLPVTVDKLPEISKNEIPVEAVESIECVEPVVIAEIPEPEVLEDTKAAEDPSDHVQFVQEIETILPSEEVVSKEIPDTMDGITTDPSDLLGELEQLLFPFGAWMSQSEDAAEEEDPSAIPGNGEGESTVEDSEEKPIEPPAQESELHMDMMQETGEILLELQRRLRARETGEPVESHEEQKQGLTVEEPDHEKDSGSRGIAFWVFMILLMIVLALVGFFGVLYFKGYFG